jgi:hypothetical protein
MKRFHTRGRRSARIEKHFAHLTVIVRERAEEEAERVPMGQKVNPIGLRLGINRTWDSRWFSRGEYGNQLLDDLKLRKFRRNPADPGGDRGC